MITVPDAGAAGLRLSRLPGSPHRLGPSLLRQAIRDHRKPSVWHDWRLPTIDVGYLTLAGGGRCERPAFAPASPATCRWRQRHPELLVIANCLKRLPWYVS